MARDHCSYRDVLSANQYNLAAESFPPPPAYTCGEAFDRYMYRFAFSYSNMSNTTQTANIASTHRMSSFRAQNKDCRHSACHENLHMHALWDIPAPHRRRTNAQNTTTSGVVVVVVLLLLLLLLVAVSACCTVPQSSWSSIKLKPCWKHLSAWLSRFWPSVLSTSLSSTSPPPPNPLGTGSRAPTFAGNSHVSCANSCYCPAISLLLGILTVTWMAPEAVMPCRRLEGILESMNLVQHVTAPTHKHGHTLDLIIIAAGDSMLTDFHVKPPSLSDQSLLICTHDSRISLHSKRVVRYRRLKGIERKDQAADVARDLSQITDCRPEDYDNVLSAC